VKQVRFHRAASTEAAAAVRWYNERVAGLGEDFRTELIAGIERIAEKPLTWPSSVYDRRTRSYLLSRFPYSIVYVPGVDGGVTIAAIAHVRRRPGYWRKRVE
jgi:toxin ParE1/3/4